MRKPGDNAQKVPRSSIDRVISPSITRKYTFTVRADREAFKRLLTMTDASWKLAQWSVLLYKLESYVVPQAVFKHQAVDVLSKLVTVRSDKSELHDKVSVLAINSETLTTLCSARFK